MRASIITIGDEIVTGDIVDLNSKFLCEQLNKLGYEIYNTISVGDNRDIIVSNINQTLACVDLLIVTGGLGPTIDDITLECVAEALNKSLEFDQGILDAIVNRFNKLGRVMTDNNRKQAYKIEGSTVIDNFNGTAPGSMVEANDKKILVLPGPPRELEMMFMQVSDSLKTEDVIKSVMVRCIGIGESSLETEIVDIISNDEIQYGIYANKQFVDVKITAKNSSEKVVDLLIEKYKKLLVSRLSKYIYSFDKNIVEVIVDILKEKNQTISIAESCSGGMLSSMFVDYSGVSSVFNEGVVTYSNQSKSQRLGIDEEFINKYGAVSEEVAMAMAKGVCDSLNSDIGIATTGIAGPNGGSVDKPVGLVYVSVYYNDQFFTEKFQLKGNRNIVRANTCMNALEMLYSSIK